MAKLQLRAVSNWRDGWRWYSAWLIAAAAAAPAALPSLIAGLPTVVLDWLPVEFDKWVVSGLAVAAFIARFIDQSIDKDDHDSDLAE